MNPALRSVCDEKGSEYLEIMNYELRRSGYPFGVAVTFILASNPFLQIAVDSLATGTDGLSIADYRK